MRLTRSLAVGLLLLLCTAAVQAAPDFPELTGRVVDNAELLDTSTETQLSSTLEAHEKSTGEQVVVVTVPDLGGETIEQYGYQLGREWGIGQEDEDNGALLIVALDERKVRIEVGYGLEGRLTDAQSSAIITQVITPAFRDGDYARGIVEGSQAIVQVLGGDPLAQADRQRPERESQEPGGAGIWLSILLFIVMMIVRGGGGRGGRGLLGGMLLGGALGGGRSGGGLGGGGGFSGGGGGFGGGGASGGW